MYNPETDEVCSINVCGHDGLELELEVLREGDDDDEHYILDLRSEVVVCGECDGRGKHSKHIGAITQEDLERDWSYDEFDAYMAGAYDKTCNECRGKRVVAVPDWDWLKKMQPDIYKAVCDFYDELAYRARERAAELRWGY